MRNDDFTFDPVMVDPAESFKVELELFGKCANFWRPNEPFTASEFVRPGRATGFAYQASTDGLSGAREPVWPTTLGGTMRDGSLLWTCVAAGTNGLNAVSAPVASSYPPGLTISTVSVSESTIILATYAVASGIEGQQFEAIFDFTLNGVTRRARQLVILSKR
jgi:hypothetical protein